MRDTFSGRQLNAGCVRGSRLAGEPATVAGAVQSGAAVIPRSTKRTRMAANLALADFELSSAHMMVIDSLDGSDPRAVHAPPSPPKLCKDEHANCEQWADAGECDNNPAFMHQTCAGSCGTCAIRKNNVEL